MTPFLLPTKFLWTFAKRLIAHGLKCVEILSALFASVFVGRHICAKLSGAGGHIVGDRKAEFKPTTRTVRRHRESRLQAACGALPLTLNRLKARASFPNFPRMLRRFSRISLSLFFGSVARFSGWVAKAMIRASPAILNTLAASMGTSRCHLSAPRDTISYWDGDSMQGKPSVKISLGEQRAYFYKSGQLVGISQLSTGREGIEYADRSNFQSVRKTSESRFEQLRRLR